MSGYGGSGDTHCASIDMVAGRMASNAASVTGDGEAMSTDPNFKLDAARIYISQKTDIDTNFGITDGLVGNATAKSGIGLKADGVRIVAREGIKLVTKTDMKNSQGGAVDQISGIDLIAGNDDEELQPIPLGNNLEEALVKLTDHHRLWRVVFNAIDCLADTKRSLMTQRANLIMFKETYFAVSGGKYINSRYNNVN